jgi:hypothetical protein
MSTRRRIHAVAFAAVLTAACLPSTSAAAAGPPLPSSQSGRTGAVAPGGSERLLTRRAGREATLVRAVRRRDGRVLRSREIAGRWAVPAVTLAGGTTGISADGRTLLLARPVAAYPPSRTRLAVVGVKDLAVRREIALPGFFAVDAISPDGRWAYLTQYAGDDPFDYRVRAIDLATGELAARDIVDPREPDEQMRGLAMTRAMSRDGRWAYTLYGGGSETFIHALDTVGRTAACIDLEMLAPQSDLSGVVLRVSGDGGRIFVREHGEVVATVDARTFKVSEGGESAAAAAPAPVRPAPADDSGGGVPWAPIAVAFVALVALGLVAARRVQRSRSASARVSSTRERTPSLP